MRRSRLIFAVLLFATTAHAQYARYGDLLVNVDCRLAPCPAEIGIFSPALLIRGEIVVGAMGYGPHAIATAPDGSIVLANGLKRFSRTGVDRGTYPLGASASSLTFDAAGFLYAS